MSGNDYNDALAIGTVLRSDSFEYRLVGVLGRGGFGITYVAVGRRVDGSGIEYPQFKCAIKEHFYREVSERDPSTQAVTYRRVSADRVEQSKRDFLVEARRINRICTNQPCIINVGEVFESNNTAYYVMEYIEGSSLRAYVEEKGRPLTDQEMLDVMVPVINAVSYLHDNHLTHLDIKPDNIMVTTDADGRIRPVLIDFGLSKQYGDDGAPMSVINIMGCSDGYSPLEQYAGITSFTPQADVYSLGATMLFCLTLKDPPKAVDVTPERVMEMMPAEVSEPVKDIVLAAMRRVLFERPPTAREILLAPSVEEVVAAYGGELNPDDYGAAPSVSYGYEDDAYADDEEYDYDEPRSSAGKTIAWIFVSVMAIAVIVFFLLLNFGKSRKTDSTLIQEPTDTVVIYDPNSAY